MRTRILGWLLCVASACGAACPAASAQSSTTAVDSASIVAIIADLDAAWHDADADRWVAHYVPDARFINIVGMLMPDTRTLRSRLDGIFNGVFKGTRHVGTLRHLRFIGADAAVADEDIRITGFSALPAGSSRTEPGVLRTRMRHVLQRIDGRWWIVASQNTPVAPAP